MLVFQGGPEQSLIPINTLDLEDLQETTTAGTNTTITTSAGEENRKLLEEATFAQNAAISVLQAENKELRAELAKLQDAVKTIFSEDLNNSLIEFVMIDFPTCCSKKEKIVRHYFNVRSFCTTSFTENCKKKQKEYGSASMK